MVRGVFEPAQAPSREAGCPIRVGYIFARAFGACGRQLEGQRVLVVEVITPGNTRLVRIELRLAGEPAMGFGSKRLARAGGPAAPHALAHFQLQGREALTLIAVDAARRQARRSIFAFAGGEPDSTGGCWFAWLIGAGRPPAQGQFVKPPGVGVIGIFFRARV